MAGDAAYDKIIQDLDDRGYELREPAEGEEPDPNFQIWESPDVEIQVFYASDKFAPRARSKTDQRTLIFDDLMM